eukprot:107584-Pyramimonas_sp.AAC.1
MGSTLHQYDLQAASCFGWGCAYVLLHDGALVADRFRVHPLAASEGDEGSRSSRKAKSRSPARYQSSTL